MPARHFTKKTTAAATTLVLALLAVLPTAITAWRVGGVGPQHAGSSTRQRTRPLAMTSNNVLPDQPPPSPDSSSSSSSTSTSSTETSSPVAQTFSPFLGRQQQRRPGLLFEEEIDFCLAVPTLEGMSVGNNKVEIAKLVNSFANQGAKKILIGVDCCFADMADAVKDRLRTEYADPADAPDVEGACGFIDAVSSLSPCSELRVSDAKAALQPAYIPAYGRVLETLLGNSCEFRASPSSPEEDKKDAKLRPRDRDICLSLYDTITGAPTKTKVLNVISNRVSRTMLYGDEDDVAKLTTELTSGRAAFLDQWVGGEAACDEGVFYDSLLAHLTGGLEAPPPAAMGGGFSNAYQRFMGLLVQEVGSRSASVDGELFDSFVRWESTLRKNLTQDMWDPHPKELTGQWTLTDNGANPATLVEKKKDQRVSSLVFRRDGTLRLPPELGLDGSWSFEPGPTHLDTIRFTIRLGTPDNRVLSYTGYVDRGQRIETRFSKRPIKMKGRVVLRVRGEARSSSEFKMMLCKKNMLLENLVVGSTRGTLQELE